MRRRSFYSSTGDFQVATYTLSNKEYSSQAYMLLCDDTVRDYEDVEVVTFFQKKCEQRGFYTVSMKEDSRRFMKKGRVLLD